MPASRRPDRSQRLPIRAAAAWRALTRDERAAALTSVALGLSLLTPWYTQTDLVLMRHRARVASASLNAFNAFSFAEALVLALAIGVPVLLFLRAEDRARGLAGLEGALVAGAGACATLVIAFRLLHKPTREQSGHLAATVGVSWGIFVSLLIAIALLSAGLRMRAASRAPVRRVREPAADLPIRASRGPGAAAAKHDADVVPGVRRRLPFLGVRAAPLPAAAPPPDPPPAPAPEPEPPPPRASPPGRPPQRMVTREDAAQLEFERPPRDERPPRRGG